ncbi:MAG TPA: FAD-binding oxidoreductase [Chloroflexota bacterium]
MRQITVQNWFGGIVSSPRVIVEVKSVEEIVAILKDPERYPSPVRAVGSNHSTTPCGTADGGTLIVMRGMDRILEIRDDEVTAEAGALYIDVNQELQKHDLQFYVNVELGNLSIGSAACGGTKDASMPGEFGQVASYATRIKMITPAGELVEVTADDPELLQVTRSSYGLFGIIYEATFKVRPLAPMRVYHERYSIDEFADRLPALKARGESIMMYINPFLDIIFVEFRAYREGARPRGLTDWQWRLRNFIWSTMAPLWAHYVTSYVPLPGLRDWLLDQYNRVVSIVAVLLVRGGGTVPQAQQIRYPSPSTNSRYLFSIWAFPEESYIDALRAYFAFSRDYFRRTGYRPNLLSVGYRIRADQSSLFSYSFHGPVMTFDPVSTGNPGWDEFLRHYNELCSGLGGTPLFNQTNLLTRPQVDKAFGDRTALFDRYRRRFDPTNRLLNAYFDELLARPATGEVAPAGQAARIADGGD